MKSEIENALIDMIDLLVQAKFYQKANWYKQRLDSLKKLSESSDEFKKIALELKGSIAGMGSFSDVPLYSLGKNSVERIAINKLQSELGEKLYELTNSLK